MLNSGNTLRSSLGMLFVDALAPTVGVAISLFFAIENYFLIFAFAFLLGSFFYIGAGNLLPEASRMNSPIVTFASFLSGFFIIFLISRFVIA